MNQDVVKENDYGPSIVRFWKYITLLFVFVIYLYFINMLNRFFDYAVFLGIIGFVYFLFSRRRWRESKFATVLGYIGIFSFVSGAILAFLAYVINRSLEASDADLSAIIIVVVPLLLSYILLTVGVFGTLYYAGNNIKLLLIKKVVILIISFSMLFGLFYFRFDLTMNFHHLFGPNITRAEAIEIAEQSITGKTNLSVISSSLSKNSLTINPVVYTKKQAIKKSDDIFKQVYTWNVVIGYDQVDDNTFSPPERCDIKVQIGEYDREIYRVDYNNICQNSFGGYDYDGVMGAVFRKFKDKKDLLITNVEIDNQNQDSRKERGTFNVTALYDKKCELNFSINDSELDISNLQDACSN